MHHIESHFYLIVKVKFRVNLIDIYRTTAFEGHFSYCVDCIEKEKCLNIIMIIYLIREGLVTI